jgi:predicted esterase
MGLKKMSLLRLGGVGLLALAGTAFPATGQAESILSSAPEDPDVSATYIFYLHGQIIERAGRRPTHPQFGVYEYDEILRALSGSDRVVVSEQRAPDTDVAEYADSIAAEVSALIAKGVPAEQIAVVGFSKGGRIAIATSSLMREAVTYVLRRERRNRRVM